MIDELVTLAYTATATDSDIPTQTLDFSLAAGSAGTITPASAFAWTPTEADGPGTYTATVRVSDGALDDTEMITITVDLSFLCFGFRYWTASSACGHNGAIQLAQH